MESKYITSILKPYIECGFPHTDYYSGYGMGGADMPKDSAFKLNLCE